MILKDWENWVAQSTVQSIENSVIETYKRDSERNWWGSFKKAFRKGFKALLEF